MIGYNIWRYDKEQTRDLFLDGEPVVTRGSDYLGNDFLIEGLRELGYWDRITSQQPELGRKDVAEDSETLNAVWILKELAGLARVSEAEKLLKDGRLMALCGFNAERISERALANRSAVVSLRTLYRHARRVPQSESERMLLSLTTMARENKWLRGKVYAADCFEIPVSGKKMEGIYENTNKTTRRGYRLLTITNVTPKREQIVAAVLGGICQDERVLLKRALHSLSSVCEPKDMIDLLLLDRGFWKAQLMWELSHEWKIPFLTLAKEKMDLVDEVERRVREQGDVTWNRLSRKSGHTGHMRQYRARAVEEVFLDRYSRDGKQAGSVNCVLAYAEQPAGKPPKRLIYVTSEPTKNRELWAIKRYGERWSIENECMKWLSEHDGRTINGWTLDAVQYRLFLLCALRNAMTLIDWKCAKDAAQMRKLLAQRKRRAYIEGHGIVIYTESGVFGTYPSEEAVMMAEERGSRCGSRRVINQVKKEVQQLGLPGIEACGPLVARLDEIAGDKRSD